MQLVLALGLIPSDGNPLPLGNLLLVTTFIFINMLYLRNNFYFSGQACKTDLRQLEAADKILADKREDFQQI